MLMAVDGPRHSERSQWPARCRQRRGSPGVRGGSRTTAMAARHRVNAAPRRRGKERRVTYGLLGAWDHGTVFVVCSGEPLRGGS